jgi:hypothetical protein
MLLRNTLNAYLARKNIEPPRDGAEPAS